MLTMGCHHSVMTSWSEYGAHTKYNHSYYHLTNKNNLNNNNAHFYVSRKVRTIPHNNSDHLTDGGGRGHLFSLFDRSCMVPMEVSIVYNQTVRGTIMKTQDVDCSR